MHPGINAKALLLASLLCVASLASHATTWAPAHVRDPITQQQVKVQQPASSGSYIYHWPEKSDQVFWPYTTDDWLWFNPKSGYIAFGNDFEELDLARRATLQAWLKAHYHPKAPPQSRRERLMWAEKVYAARGMDDDFWAYFYRLMAFETRDDTAAHLAYVRKALPLLEKELAASTDADKTLKDLYLLGEYHRRLGHREQAKTYLDRLSAMQVDDALSGYKTYLLEIAAQQQAGAPRQTTPSEAASTGTSP